MVEDTYSEDISTLQEEASFKKISQLGIFFFPLTLKRVKSVLDILLVGGVGLKPEVLRS